MKYELNAYSIYELGQRANQEDSIYPAHEQITASDRVFIVCDGMGGHESGEEPPSLAYCRSRRGTNR